MMLAQEVMIGRVRQLCQEDERVAAALMYGSFSKAAGDAFSDIEFFIFLEDEAYDRVEPERWVAQVAPLAFYFVNEFGVGAAIFQNLIRGEFHFEKASTMDQIREWKALAGFPLAEAMLVLDRHGELMGHLRAISGPGPERQTAENAAWVWHSYVNWMLFGANVYARGERARALEFLWFGQRHLLWLARLVEGRTERWQTPSKEVELDLSATAYERFVACGASLKEGDLGQAYLAAWEWGKEMGEALASRYDFDLGASLIEQLDTRFNAAFGWDEVAILETERLMVRAAEERDGELFYLLWTDPRVMANVGFPQGLPITRQEIRQKLLAQEGTVFGQRLVVTLKHNGQAIGECKMGWPDGDGVAETDVKLLPAFWGHKYGVEVKQGLLDYLFQHTECQAVQATPNVGNVASIKMQEAVGGVRLGEATYEFPEAMAEYTMPVHHYIYHVRRADWKKGRDG